MVYFKIPHKLSLNMRQKMQKIPTISLLCLPWNIELIAGIEVTRKM